MFINVTVESKNKKSFNQFLTVFKHLSKKQKLNKKLSFVQKTQRKKKFTILNSPHANKIAQEHFEYSVFSKKIRIKTFQILKILVLLKKIKLTFFSDVGLKINFDINSKNNHKLLIQKLFPKKNSFFKIPENKKQLEFYLLMFHFYGKYHF